MIASYLRWTAIWSLATAYWAGVITESIATCVSTSVCSYPRTAFSDAAVLVFFACMAIAARNGFMAAKLIRPKEIKGARPHSG